MTLVKNWDPPGGGKIASPAGWVEVDRKGDHMKINEPCSTILRLIGTTMVIQVAWYGPERTNSVMVKWYIDEVSPVR